MPSTLETPRLRLRPRDGRDAEWNLALLAEHPLDPSPGSLEEERERLDAQRRRFDEHGFGLYTIELAETGEPVGYCGLVVGRASAAQPELAYELLRAYVGSGYATEAASAVADAAFDAGFPVIWATVATWNAPSFGVLAKLGFSKTRRVGFDGGSVYVWLRRRAPRRRHREAP
ncbi:GNAT family N-acetyltransferase [Leifsonia sp. fls2-241-R2A-40a]|uniref:GNAT family N-acetyltransferase n=1 Tax=Leifsonia sp. fls2-241-R2A-40a TaxID=3040290 RepID=UPI0025500A88|nr:GNAT family N-acetyltransferase [Leifsonia sp. fls2-241-R2A-40a]